MIVHPYKNGSGVIILVLSYDVPFEEELFETLYAPLLRLSSPI